MSSIPKEIYHLTISINKALSPGEAPLKIKHARSVIITTHRTKEAKTFWTIVIRQPLMANRFTAWKFCHLLHKVLREGHPSALKQSLTHKKMILEVGKLWGHLQDGVGNCIYAYSKLIVTKLEFHEKNVQFPGSLLIEFEEYERVTGNDINDYFQLCVEIFDYLDAILEVQSQVFTSINAYRMYSMTPQGQCRLAPLIPLIQDSNPLYDVCVRVMFKLHNHLSSDILVGHRDRFREIFAKLKAFYDLVRPLQYFADLIQVPQLPDAAPNFKSQVDFGSYIPPVMYVQPEPEPELVVDNLVDTTIQEDLQDSSSSSTSMMMAENSRLVEMEQEMRERDFTIQSLQDELMSARQMANSLESQYREDMLNYREKVDELNNELAAAKELYVNMRSERDDLELKVANAPTLLQKATEGEEKAKASEEKFNKLRIMYTQIRDEHINLLRQNGESAKQLNKEKLEMSQLKAKHEELKIQLNAYQEEQEKTKAKSSELETEHAALQRSLDAQQQLYLALQTDYDKLQSTYCADSERLSEKVCQLEMNAASIEKYKSTIENLEEKIREVTESKLTNDEAHEALVQTYKQNVQTLEQQVEALRQTKEEVLSEKEQKTQEFSAKLATLEADLKVKEAERTKSNTELETVQGKLSEALARSSDLTAQCEALDKERREIIVSTENRLRELVARLLKTVENATTNNEYRETNKDSLEKIPGILEKFDKTLKEAGDIHGDDFKVDRLVDTAVWLGFHYTLLYEQCQFVWSTSTNIEKGEALIELMRGFEEPLLRVLRLLGNVKCNPADLESSLGVLRTKIEQMRKLVTDLIQAPSDIVGLENLVEQELSEMDRAIAEAANKFIELMSNARQNDKGLQLEVNEKILDACTALMKSIQLLIQRSKVLQGEIVAAGKGSSSAKEFYKRNSQWTEGLISASKSVARGAKLLVDAANKAVNGESNQSFGIIVAAQEIAACTAQLVISSKVKAPKQSNNLSELTTASRHVSNATGVVVATVKDCIQQLDQEQDMDFSKLNSSQLKTVEMDMHVTVLELENALENARYKLTTFRKNHYQSNDG